MVLAPLSAFNLSYRVLFSHNHQSNLSKLQISGRIGSQLPASGSVTRGAGLQKLSVRLSLTHLQNRITMAISKGCGEERLRQKT